MSRLLLVTGSGRSGTSSAAGALQRLGMVIPQPEVEADERNPRGYYEPLWIAAFHKRWLNRIPVRTIDARPDAGAIAMATVTDEHREQLTTWLREELAGRGPDDVVLVKETRAYWVFDFWAEVAAGLGVELMSLTMLRHPTQVVRSRDSAYLSGETEELRRQRESTNVAAWANSVVATERATRGVRRAFVTYPELVGDWRTALGRATTQLGYDPGDLGAPHAVDDFLTSSLNRSADTWDGLHVPEWLHRLGEDTWAAARLLVDDPTSADAAARLDALDAGYREDYAVAVAVAADETMARVDAVRRPLEKDVQRQAKKIERKDERLNLKNERLAALREEVRVLREQLAGRTGNAGESA